jgi:hypothetical protein
LQHDAAFYLILDNAPHSSWWDVDGAIAVFDEGLASAEELREKIALKGMNQM